MASKARTVPVESAQVGDEATFTWQAGDVTRMAHGRIADIVRHGHERILHSESGVEIVRYNLRTPRRVQCVIHRFYVPEPPALFGVDCVV